MSRELSAELAQLSRSKALKELIAGEDAGPAPSLTAERQPGLDQKLAASGRPHLGIGELWMPAVAQTLQGGKGCEGGLWR
jgi:hypothetical protein